MGLGDLRYGTFTVAEAKRSGLSPRTLYRLRDAGKVEQVGPGLYRDADAPATDLDLLEIAVKAPRATLCLSSALAHHDLIDMIPGRIDVALPRGRTGPVTLAPASWHYFNQATFDLERSRLEIPGESASMGIYSAERSIVDAFRLRGSEGHEIGIEALKNWLRRRGSRPARLLTIAQQIPRSTGPIKRALEFLA
ncbi:type IV toxin-antitoxin system AbiEi family antitoxin domain-containing protein [Arthrobacter sp. A2-55]|uniref:type IV toxin-antitoxin system AbiEi family antitoxin domain-containing protein n=1 Tax=Arthrobacter sp. A2-55 TaxID=2897337 RepID=UPI0021CDCA19|nr:type IV toxin-antitoxin system AbiEi family antitoxin domain-containing protein [Arthrobacter sp. A2-55]MCU6481989.1 type IV toxin-antitoxin system AbiEi family antitoxin domain-containing protein [Arthrobacter sp. A2-55]